MAVPSERNEELGALGKVLFLCPVSLAPALTPKPVAGPGKLPDSGGANTEMYKCHMWNIYDRTQALRSLRRESSAQPGVAGDQEDSLTASFQEVLQQSTTSTGVAPPGVVRDAVCMTICSRPRDCPIETGYGQGKCWFSLCNLSSWHGD